MNPQKMALMRLGNKIMSSKRYIAHKYGKGLMLNKVRAKKKKELMEINYMNKIKETEEYMKK